MIIYVGADHRGFALKEKLKQMLIGDGYTVTDCGAASYDQADDYPDFAEKVADAVGSNPGVGSGLIDDGDRGILVCGSGFGMDIAANKFKNVRSVLPSSPDHAYVARHDDNANILVLAADFTDDAAAEKIIKTFLATPFAQEERYKRRLAKISEIEGA